MVLLASTLSGVFVASENPNNSFPQEKFITKLLLTELYQLLGVTLHMTQQLRLNRKTIYSGESQSVKS